MPESEGPSRVRKYWHFDPDTNKYVKKPVKLLVRAVPPPPVPVPVRPGTEQKKRTPDAPATPPAK